MELIAKLMEFFQSNTVALIVTILWSISEGLTAIPSIKANGVFQAIRNGLKWIKDKVIK